MLHPRQWLVRMTVVLLAGLAPTSCSSDVAKGEESGVYVARTDTWDATRRGAHLVLSFDPTARNFSGRVTNTTSATLCAVRVEVHLEGGGELGPTEKVDLAGGQSADITLTGENHDVDRWTAHPEVSSCGG